MKMNLKINQKLNFKKIVKYLMVLLVLIIFLYYENNSIKVTNLDLKLDKLPQGFEGFKIVQISDLHNKEFGNSQHRLVDKVKKAQPELIVITGDLVDSRKYDEKPAVELAAELCKIAPVYYVPGNHEFFSGSYSSLEENLQRLGVSVLRNSKASFERNGDEIDIVGVDDPAGSDDLYVGEKDIMTKELQKALVGSQQQTFKILLSHRPELIDVYAKNNIDLTFSGHAHGGQIRLPFIKGIVAPNQGFLPKYTAGKYNEGSSVMIVSRGLGNSIIPQRIFNRPEIVVAKLSRK